MHIRTAALIFLAAAACLPACGGGGDAGDLFRAGRYEECRDILADEIRAAGDSASPELLYNHALAALRAGDLTASESSAGKAVTSGGPDLRALAAFDLGCCRFARCRMAALQADTPEAEPFAFDIAIKFGEGARDHWAAASALGTGWPEAEQNLERALLLIEELRGKKAEAEARREKPPAPEPPPVPEPPDLPDPEGETTGEEAEIRAQESMLSPEKVLSLLEVLAEKEREKREIRRERGSAGVERGW